MNLYEIHYLRQQKETDRMRKTSKLTLRIQLLNREVQILLAVIVGLVWAIVVLMLLS